MHYNPARFAKKRNIQSIAISLYLLPYSPPYPHLGLHGYHRNHIDRNIWRTYLKRLHLIVQQQMGKHYLEVIGGEESTRATIPLC